MSQFFTCATAPTFNKSELIHNLHPKRALLPSATKDLGYTHANACTHTHTRARARAHTHTHTLHIKKEEEEMQCPGRATGGGCSIGPYANSFPLSDYFQGGVGGGGGGGLGLEGVRGPARKGGGGAPRPQDIWLKMTASSRCSL